MQQEKENRMWHMNRMGFVNFWLYDREEFYFSDGKLMLRGQNASGKSITTQSFVPFILDGNRAPSRLDPFGSSDRKMEYYFLGNDERDDVTGYLFLEFKKEGLEEYRTIGIGQRARRGKKSMDFWGFIVLDGRRVQMELPLCQEMGTQFVPLTKRQLKNQLGEENLLFESPSEYKRNVNKYLFGFEKDEQYEQFIQLLIKVRAPKLSKEFKPSKVYEILNDSLQTLSDEDLQTMVEAMEKLDDIENRLDGLRKANRELKNVQASYRRYNRCVRMRKSTEYLKAREKAKKAADEHDKKLKEIASNKAQQEDALKKSEKLKAELDDLSEKLAAWESSELYASLEQKDLLRQRVEEKAAELGMITERIEEEWAELRQVDRKIADADTTLESIESACEEYEGELSVLQEIIHFELHEKLSIIQEEGADKDKLDYLFAEIADALKQLEEQIKQGIKALTALDECMSAYDESSREDEECAVRLQNCISEEEKALQREMIEKDNLIENLYLCRKDCSEFSIDDEVMGKLRTQISSYSGEQQEQSFRNTLRNVYEGIRGSLHGQQYMLEHEKKEAQKRLTELTDEYESLRKKKEPEPSRSEETLRIRSRLSEAGISFVSLYEAIDFSDTCADEKKALLEKQLKMSGLIDALVVAESHRGKAVSILGEGSDIVLCAGRKADMPVKEFAVADELKDRELREEAGLILSSFSSVEDGGKGSYILSGDGYFRNGVLSGYAALNEGEAAGFIGIGARRKNLAMQVEAKKRELDAQESICNTIRQKYEAIRARIAALDEEYGLLPTMEKLAQAHAVLNDKEKALDMAREERAKAAEALEKAKAAKESAEREVIVSCGHLSYDRSVACYSECLDAVGDYRSYVGELKVSRREWIVEMENRSRLSELVEGCKNRIDRLELDKRTIKRDHDRVKASYDAVIAMLEDPEMKEQAMRMEKARARREQCRSEIEECNIILTRMDERIRQSSAQVDELSEISESRRYREKVTESYLEEELMLSLEADEKEMPSKDEDSYILRYAKAMAGSGEPEENYEDRLMNLIEVINRNRSNLGAYQLEMRSEFDESEIEQILRRRSVVVAVWNGVVHPLHEFALLLSGAIEETESLIQKKDRELFEKILSDTISRKLTSRIRESRSWIAEMSDIMQRMETSMGMNFILKWQPRQAESEDEMATKDLERILMLDRELATDEDIDRLTKHFRIQIKNATREALEKEQTPNYYEMIREALDYRKWFAFKLYYLRSNEAKRELTDRAFNRFSGGEKAMAMYIPLFAAVNAQYKKAKRPDHPRIIALDEAFAGVDEKNISTMFELVETLEFDYIMNSQSLWGCYDTVKHLRIAELLRPENASYVTVISYIWDGKQKRLEA